MKPFLKWAGNKYKIVSRILQVLPPGRRLIEPFIGSGAVFLNTNYPRYLLADSNPDLIYLYTQLKKEGLDFINYCETFFETVNNTKTKYQELRSLFNTTSDRTLKSALFIYLNKHCFNGLCRYNSKNKFNVPFGKRSKAYFPRKELLYFCNKSTLATFKHSDFISTLKKAVRGDVIYCDPPYSPLSKTANFTNYSGHEFTEEAHHELATRAEKLAARGITTVISNHNTPFVKTLYRNAKIMKISVQRSISRDGKNRARVGEVIAVFGKL